MSQSQQTFYTYYIYHAQGHTERKPETGHLTDSRYQYADSDAVAVKLAREYTARYSDDPDGETYMVELYRNDDLDQHIATWTEGPV